MIQNKSILFELDKIFTNEENSYIYEEVCRDTIIEAFKGKNFCYLGFGLTHTAKKSTIFGGKDCLTNINTRGIFFRILENLTNIINTDKTDFSLNISYTAIYANKYMDMSVLFGKNFSDYPESQVLSLFKEFKAYSRC